MMPSFPSLSVSLISTISLLGTVYARTILEGCTFTETVSEKNEYSIVWYVPETGEICDVSVCGGGLDPFDYDNPACPEYTGTAPYKPSYLADYGPSPTAVTAETAADAAVTSAADWDEGEAGDEDDEFVSATITSTRFSSTVATGSTETARSTSIPVIPSSRASLTPWPTSTSSAAVSESAHDSTTIIRTSPVASSLPRPFPTTNPVTNLASESAYSSTSLIGSSPVSLLPTPPLSPWPTTYSTVPLVTPSPAPLQPVPPRPAPSQPVALIPEPPKLAPPKLAPPELAPPQPAPPQPPLPQPALPQPVPPTTSSINTGVGGSPTMIGVPTVTVIPAPAVNDGASLRLGTSLGALGLLATIVL
ncbi:hypothetical protein BDV09DRAFT_195999 [Aspergillus tetrazonus]